MNFTVAEQQMIWTDTLADARSLVESKKDDGIECPCCTQFVKRYRRKLNSGMARALILLVVDGCWVTARRLASISREAAQLSWWGLAEEQANDDPKKKTSGLWRATERGVAFAREQVYVASHAVVFDAKLETLAGELVGIRAALGEHFDYDELMKGGMS